MLKDKIYYIVDDDGDIWDAQLTFREVMLEAKKASALYPNTFFTVHSKENPVTPLRIHYQNLEYIPS